ncbi:hypothetical protein BH10BDE1_BH10BDE1_08720 [soil metagenome]
MGAPSGVEFFKGFQVTYGFCRFAYMNRSSLGVVFATVLLVGSVAQSACESWASACQDIQTFRARQLMRPKRLADRVCAVDETTEKSNGPLSILKQTEKIAAVFASGKDFDAKKFASCLQDVDQRFSALQDADLKVLTKALADAKITGVTTEKLKTIFFDPESGYSKQKAAIKAANPDFFYLRDYTLSGPYQAMEESLRGTKSVTTPDGTVVTAPKYERSGLDQLTKLESASAILKFLEARAAESSLASNGGFPISPKSSRESMTPAVSKLILFELLKDAYSDQPEKLAAIAGQLTLKFDYENPNGDRPGSFISTSLHNGYFLGANPANFPTPGAVPSSVGVDCTAMIQKCQQDAGVQFPPDFKLLSSRVVSMFQDPEAEQQFPEIASYKRLYDVEKYECEAQLEAGDTIVFNGHAFVFNGYVKDKTGNLQVSTFEAIAGEYRSAGSFLREMYDQDPCKPAAFSSGGERNAVILRVKK